MLVQLALIALLAVLIGSLLVSAISYARAWRIRRFQRPQEGALSLIKFSKFSKKGGRSRLEKTSRLSGDFPFLNRCRILAVAVFSFIFAIFSIQWQSLSIALPNYVSEIVPVLGDSALDPDIVEQCRSILTEVGNRSAKTQPKSIPKVSDFLYYSNSQNSALGLAAAQISDDGLPRKAEFLCGTHLRWIYENFVGRSLFQRNILNATSYTESGIEIYVTSAEERDRLVIYKSPVGEISLPFNFVSFSYFEIKSGDSIHLVWCRAKYHFLPWSYYEEFSSRIRGIKIEARRIFDVPLFLVDEGNGPEVFWGSFALHGVKPLKFTVRRWENAIMDIDSYWSEWEQTFDIQKITKALEANGAAQLPIGSAPTQIRMLKRSGSVIVNSEECQEALREARNLILRDR